MSRGFNVLAFPCNQFGKQEPGTNEEIKHFARVNMTATFPLFDKVCQKHSKLSSVFRNQ